MLQHIEEARQGDRQAFEHIVRHYAAMANAVAYEKLHDFQLAEDAVQEAFTEAFLHLNKLRSIEAFPGWFKAIVARQCFRIIRRKQHLAIPYDEVAESAESPICVSVFNHLYEGGKDVLHIVNGDSVAQKLQNGIVQGDVLVWREVYPHGPVTLDSSALDNRFHRAQYLEQTLGVPQKEYIQNRGMQEKALADSARYDEIILWFEHDLFDQTMLCFLLHWFSEHPLKSTKLSLLCIGEYPGIELFRGLGQLSQAQMETLSGTWKTIGAEELDLGRLFWQAYTSQDPRSLQQLLREDTSALPFAHDAFQMHLSRFPSTYNGLGIVEQTTLEMIHEGIHSPQSLFEQIGNKLHRLGMGDLEYWHILKKVSQDPYPLLQISGLPLPTYNDSSLSLQDRVVALTELGRNVMDGKEDWAEKKGIDAWYGGVHLQGHFPSWRWDSSMQTIRETGTEA